MITVQDMVYVRYQAPDLDAMEAFMTHFGLYRSGRTADRLFMRGVGSDPVIHVTERGAARTVGYALLAQSRADLQTLAAETGTRVETRDEPGGGQVVRLKDPAGYQVDVVYGIEPVAPMPISAAVAFNVAHRGARVNTPVLRGQRPSHVLRLGHMAVKVPDLRSTQAFYTGLLGMRGNDTFVSGADGSTVGVFLCCGLGKRFTDHHTLALVQHPSGGFDHAGFEVPDWDDLMSGHYHMQSQPGLEHSWGVGRHQQGSNLFDYWRDPFGNKAEHWADMDLVNEEYSGAPAELRFDAVALRQWAPAFNPKFFE